MDASSLIGSTICWWEVCARTLFRIRIENNEVVALEKLVEHLGRIRDVDMGPEGFIYVLLEHQDTGSLVRLVPFDNQYRSKTTEQQRRGDCQRRNLGYCCSATWCRSKDVD